MSSMEQSAISSETHMRQALYRMAYSIGAFLGNGHARYEPSHGNGSWYITEVSSPDREVASMVVSDINDFFNKEHRIMTKRLKSGKDYYIVRSYTEFVYLFFMVNTRHRLDIPKELITAPIHIRRKLIAGMFDTDGSVKFTFNGKNPRWQLGYSGTSQDMVENLARILQNMGIRVGKVHTYQRGGYKTLWAIHPNIRDFIGAGCYFCSERKQKRLEDYHAHVCGSETMYTAPVTTGDDIVQS